MSLPESEQHAIVPKDFTTVRSFHAASDIIPVATPMAAPSDGTPPDPKLCPTDDEAIIPRGEVKGRKVDKQSLEYVVKSGIAGGIAGCAVCFEP